MNGYRDYLTRHNTSRQFVKSSVLLKFAAVLLATFTGPGPLSHAKEPDPLLATQNIFTAPIRYYTINDGLNQRLAGAMTQDQDGFLWFATWSGINRFDGHDFDSITTRNDLRINGSTALFVDRDNQLWVGDGDGGLSVLQNSKVVRTIKPHPDAKSAIRAIREVDGKLYLGFQSNGIGWLDPQSENPEIHPIPTSISMKVRTFQPTADGTILIEVTREGLYRFDPNQPEKLELIDASVSALKAASPAKIFLGSRDGRIGLWNGDSVKWQRKIVSAPILDFAVKDESPVWFSTRNHLINFESPDQKWPIRNPGRLMFDRDDVLWIVSTSGLGRYLGERFNHMFVPRSASGSIVYAIDKDFLGNYWFGTNHGLMRITKEGQVENMTDMLGIKSCEVRDIILSSNKKTLWYGCIGSESGKVDIETLETEVIFENNIEAKLSLELDDRNWLWASAARGVLLAENQTSGNQRTYSFENDKPLYSMTIDQDQRLWVAVQDLGVYHFDTTVASPQPIKTVSLEQLEGASPTLVVDYTNADGSTSLWIATNQGKIHEWRDGGIQRSLRHMTLSDQVIYMMRPLSDGTLVVGTGRGLFRYSFEENTLDFYGPNAGYLGVETKYNASFLEDESTLWIGTGDGVSRMNLNTPMDLLPAPVPSIIELSSKQDRYEQPSEGALRLTEQNISIDFGVLSTTQNGDLIYSHRMLGLDREWTNDGHNHRVNYRNLPPGKITFQVRARRDGGDWGAPTSIALIVPTPFYKSWWFLLAVACTIAFLIWARVRLHLISERNTRQRLQKLVEKRTASIQRARTELKTSNEQLKTEILERRKSDTRRIEVEERFSQAYLNSPLGMAMLELNGMVFEANPVLKSLFWPSSESERKEQLADVIVPEQRSKFAEFLRQYSKEPDRHSSEEFTCTNYAGNLRQIVFILSSIKDSSGETQYILVLANDVTESRSLTQQLQYQANHDVLTGLKNRRRFTEEMEAYWEKSSEEFTAHLILIDLDRFKIINDTCGHDAGDVLLKQVAGILTDTVRDSDDVYRLGGDEFAIVLKNCSLEIARNRAIEMCNTIESLQFRWNQEIYRIGASGGLIEIDQEKVPLSSVTQLADAACYAAKKAGGNQVHIVYEDEHAAELRLAELRLIPRIQKAIAQDDFVLFRQTIKNLQDDQSRHENYEILLRLREPESDVLLPPGAFLPAAERFGLSTAIDEWVIKNLVQNLHRYPQLHLSGQRYWINLSGASLGDKSFSEMLVATIKNCDLRPGTINFEITETAVMRDLAEARRLIDMLTEMGCEFSLDDFGSGLSSFGYLKNLRVQFLKIDGLFIRDIGRDGADRILVKSIIDIAHSLGMKTISEFVENDEIYNIVQELGSDYGQGYGIDKPTELVKNVMTLVEKTG